MECQISLRQTKILCDFTFSRNIFQFSGFTQFPSLPLETRATFYASSQFAILRTFVEAESPLKAEIHKVNNLHSCASIGEFF